MRRCRAAPSSSCGTAPSASGPEVSQLLTAYEGRESCRVSVTNSNYYRPCRQAVFVRHSSGRPSAAANADQAVLVRWPPQEIASGLC